MDETLKPARLTYVDVAKGIAMLLVVMHHCGGSLDLGMTVLTMIDVPLFFLCSGYLAYKKRHDYTIEFKKKTKGILIPFILALLFVSLVRWKNPLWIFTNDITKSGYWFLEALWIVFLLYWFIAGVCRNKLAYFGSAACIELALLAAAKFSPAIVDNLFCFSSLARYFPCFMTGIYLRQYVSVTDFNHKLIGSLLVIISAIGFLYPFDSGNVTFIACILAYSASAALLFLFIIRDEAALPAFVHSQLMLFGKYSLNIYIIHFFLVPHLPAALPHSFIFDFLYSFVLAIVISYLSIIIGKFLTFTTPLDKVLR